MSFPETTDRFIAYFDIMGFKDLIYRNDHTTVSKIIETVSSTVETLKKYEEKNLKNINQEATIELHKGIALPVIFSDSILFISKSNNLFDMQKNNILRLFFSI